MNATSWTTDRPWRGIMVATTLPFRDDLSVDYDAYAEHVAWLIANGCDGVVPNGSLGEYQTLTADERARVVRTAVEAAGDGARVMPGVAAYGSAESRRWAEQAAEAGCGSVLLLPPNAYRADERSVRAHYAEVAGVGIPVVAYNNPIDTKVDLVPGLLAKLHADGAVVAVKEFSGDVRRAYEIAELAPELDLLIGADDVLLELAVAGAVGWIAGYPNALPASSVELYRSAVAGDLAAARSLYSSLHSLLRWDSKVEFVQCIKLSMDIAGRRGGPTRPPRLPLTGATETAVRTATEKALADGRH
ncbi:dihydrodipicolinate synthase family protein [Streptomyces zaomyceticus]|uniref:dihydrodipicolinate synthase family protein n=1 Tax=Streptomyces zaomyceticus TaxID=68286 RepID=UPI00167BC0AB|nr:dihydrodipicolinate synthase family protein [Streptomyces zaomyceticus]GHG38073.1 dihydrodipicolinate synthase family protein [Streptomyces zaomyceticus]